MKLSEIATIKNRCERAQNSPKKTVKLGVGGRCAVCPLFKDIEIGVSSRCEESPRLGGTQGIEEVRLLINPCALLDEFVRKIRR